MSFYLIFAFLISFQIYNVAVLYCMMYPIDYYKYSLILSFIFGAILEVSTYIQ